MAGGYLPNNSSEPPRGAARRVSEFLEVLNKVWPVAERGGCVYGVHTVETAKSWDLRIAFAVEILQYGGANGSPGAKVVYT